jgi:hypothetical protein
MGVRVVTTLIIPAPSYDLVDLATVHDELSIKTSDISKDAFLSRAITQISTAMAGHCNRVFPQETLQDAIYPARDAYPYQLPGGIRRLQLSRWPIVSVSSVTKTEFPGDIYILAEGTDFLIEAEVGQLTRLAQYTGYPADWYPVVTTVIYTAGYAIIPDDLQDAALRLITTRFFNRGRDPTMKSQTQPGLGDQTYWVGSIPGVRGAFPEDIMAMLDRYRVPVIA